MATDAYLACPATSTFPHVYGLANSTPAYTFSPECFMKMQSIDSFDNFVVASGDFSCNTSPVTFLPDTVLSNCEGDGCESAADVGKSNQIKGVFNFYHTDVYSARKYYLINDSSRDMHAPAVQLLHEGSTHPVMALAKDNWGLKLYSGEQIRGLGAMIVVKDRQGTGKPELFDLKMFAIVQLDDEFDVRWRASIQAFSNYPNHGNTIWTSMALSYVQNNRAGQPLNLIAILNSCTKNSQMNAAFLNSLETAAPTQIDAKVSFRKQSLNLKLKRVHITPRGRVLILGRSKSKNQPFALILQQASPTALPTNQAYISCNTYYAYVGYALPSQTSDNPLILVRESEGVNEFPALDFFDGETLSGTPQDRSPHQNAINGFSLNASLQITSAKYLAMDCRRKNCVLLAHCSTDSDHFVYIVGLILTADLSGVRSINKVLRVGQPFMATSKAKVTEAAYVYYDSQQSQFISLFALQAKEVSYKVSNTSVRTPFGSSEVAVIVSTNPRDCFGIMESQDRTSSGDLTMLQASNLYEGIQRDIADLVSIALRSATQSDDYQYKIFAHQASKSSTAPVAFSPWFECAAGSVVAQAGIQNKTTVMADLVAKKMTLFTLTTTNPNRKLCRDQRPLVKSSSLTAKFSGGPAGAPETDLNSMLAHKIQSEVDCAAQGISDATECAAYVIYNALIRFKMVQDSSNPALYRFGATLPAYNARRKGLKIEVRVANLIFEEYSEEVALNWTLDYPKDPPPPTEPATSTPARGSDRTGPREENKGGANSRNSRKNPKISPQDQIKIEVTQEIADTVTTQDDQNHNQPTQQESTDEQSQQNSTEALNKEQAAIAALAEENAVELIDSLEDAQDILGVQDTVSQLLGVENVEATVAESQQVMKVQDDTDLVQAATFDQDTWMETAGLSAFKGVTSEGASPPQQLAQQDLAESFSVPFSLKITPEGILKIEMTGVIETMDPTTSFKNKRLRQLRQPAGSATSAGSAFAPTDQQLKILESFLRLSESIQVQLIPANDLYLEKKEFTWHLAGYSETGVNLQFNFQHPKYISFGGVDTLKVTLKNTDNFLKPKDEALGSIPDGYTIIIKLPPQGDSLMTQEELASAQARSQQLVISQLILSRAFKQVLSMVLGSIMVVQILAHLPLADIFLPANVLQQFQVMISFVSFDYFAPFDYINADFTEVWAWSPSFAWIGYDTVQFVPSLGSIFIFASLQIINNLVAMMIMTTRTHCKWRWAREKFSAGQAWSSSLTFMHGTFFEIAVCVCICMSMVPYWQYFNASDKLSISLAFLFLIFLLGYLGFIFYFTCRRASTLALINKAKRDEEQLALKESLKESLLAKIESSGASAEQLIQAKRTLNLTSQQMGRRIEKAGRVKDQKFDHYMPLLADIRLDERAAILGVTFLNLRRILMLFMAMFIVHKQWLQLQVFILLNFASVVYVVIVRPYDKQQLNILNTVNEVMGLLIGYFLLPMQDLRFDPEVMYAMGDFVVNLFYLSALVNVLLIFVRGSYDLYRALKKAYLTKTGICCIRKFKLFKGLKKQEKIAKQVDESHEVESVVAVRVLKSQTGFPMESLGRLAAKAANLKAQKQPREDDNEDKSASESQRSASQQESHSRIFSEQQLPQEDGGKSDSVAELEVILPLSCDDDQADEQPKIRAINESVATLAEQDQHLIAVRASHHRSGGFGSSRMGPSAFCYKFYKYTNLGLVEEQSMSEQNGGDIPAAVDGIPSDDGKQDRVKMLLDLTALSDELKAFDDIGGRGPAKNGQGSLSNRI